MAQQTEVPLDRMAQHLFGLVNALDAEAVNGLVTHDCEEVDEISRTWEWADTGVVTCVIDQTYRYQGRMERITAPTTLVFRSEGGDWRIALMHTVPLPEAPAS